MKRFSSGLIFFDKFDVFCFSFFLGSGISFLIRNRRKRKIDPIIGELTKQPMVMAISVDGKPLKVPIIKYRGGELSETNGTRLRIFVIKNKRFIAIITAIMNATRDQRLLKLLEIHFFIINAFLNSNFGVSFAIAGSFDFTQFVFIFFPASVSGFLLARIIANPMFVVLLPLAILYGRFENLVDPSENCLIWCKLAEEFHNEKFSLEMAARLKVEENTLIELPKPFVCIETPLSIIQRYALKSSLESTKARNQVKYFRDFINRIPECSLDPDNIYQEVIKEIIE